MLISDRDICAQPLPLLLIGPNQKWQLVSAVQLAGGQFSYQTSSIENGIVIDRLVKCSTPPFHVGDDVWELEYGFQIVSIRESNHAAYEIWDLRQQQLRNAESN